MPRFSFTTVISAVFIAYILHSIYSIVSIFIPPSCSDKHCLKSYLETKPKLQLVLCTTTKSSISSWNELTLLEKWTSLDYEKDLITKNITIPLPRSTRKNGTLYIYAIIGPTRPENEHWMQSAQQSHSMYSSFQLTQYLVPEAETFNLLNSKTKDENEIKKEKLKEKERKSKEKPVAHVTKKLRLVMMTEPHRLPVKDLPLDLSYQLKLVTSETYLPPMRFDKFSSNRLRDYYKINETDEEYDLEFEYSPISIGHLRMSIQFETAMETMMTFGFSLKDLDEVKGIFADTNMYLLTLTMFVASIHLLFDFLAFKNDVSYWRNRKNTVGLSSRTILWRCFSHIVIFLYLMEEKSSLLILIPGGIGTLIEVWKVTKAYKIKLDFSQGGLLPKVQFGDMSESEKATARFDVESMKYLSYLLYPLCICGAIYSLFYTPHKSWYSWTIQSVVNGVYAFGFLFMLPQLFVNYKLKSVAHLPWRAFMYKASNTFIDDLFAFIITMPTAHRLACFRDDVVFLIYLYQRWLYPVDTTRVDGGGSFEIEAETTSSPVTATDGTTTQHSDGETKKRK